MSDNLEKKVYEYSTKFKEGFIAEEIDDLLSQYDTIDMKKFNNALMGNTCMVKYDEDKQMNQLINYHVDVLKALRCGLEGRDLYLHEWD